MTDRPDARGTPDDSVVDSDRALLLNVAYRLLGSTAEAEDAVQETYVRWYRLTPQQRSEVVSPVAWLVRVTSRICLDVLGSARRRRERYVGEWLPEPLPADGRWHSQHDAGPTGDPADRITLDESVSMALLVVLESMTPAERVVFVLHDVFRHPFAEIAEIVGRSPAACRQLAASARRRVRPTTGSPSQSSTHAAIVDAFKSAWESGDLDELVRLLDPSATAVTDGGGIVSAPLEPVRGAEAVARFLLDVLVRQPDLTIDTTTVNGAPGLVARSDRQTLAVLSIGLSGDRIGHVWAVRNPDKLTAW